MAAILDFRQKIWIPFIGRMILHFNELFYIILKYCNESFVIRNIIIIGYQKHCSTRILTGIYILICLHGRHLGFWQPSWFFVINTIDLSLCCYNDNDLTLKTNDLHNSDIIKINSLLEIYNFIYQVQYSEKIISNIYKFVF